MADLTPQQQRFADEYVIDLNATHAAVRAGYSPKAAHVVGSFLTKKPLIKAEIDRLLAARRVRTEVTADRVVQELARLAFADARTLHRPDGTLKPPSEWDDDTAAQISGIEVTRTSTRTGARAHASGTHADQSIDTGIEVEEQTIKVRRHDKVKALEMLAKHTRVLGPDSTGLSTGALDPVRAARMDDSTLEQALSLARQLAALVDA